MLSYIDSAPFPPSFSPNRPFPDHFWILGNASVSYLDLFFDKYMGQPSAETYMSQLEG